MMRWLSSAKYSPIGLDLGAHSFKAVQLRKSANGRDATSTVSLPRQTPGAPLAVAEIERLQGVLDRRGFVGQDVIVAVPAAGLLSAILELPARAPGVPLEQIATAEFARVHKLEPAMLSMSTWELPTPARASRATYMLAVGARAATLDTHVDLIESTGLSVVAIEEPCSAAARGCLHGAGADSGMTAVVDLGWEAATLVILKDTTVVYTRKLTDAGLSHLYRTAIEETACEAADVEQDVWRFGLTGAASADAGGADMLDALNTHFGAVLREIGQAFGYAGHQYPDAAMSGVRLTGGGASIPGLDARFADALGVPARPAAAPGVAPALTQALGLALWQEGKQ